MTQCTGRDLNDQGRSSMRGQWLPLGSDAGGCGKGPLSPCTHQALLSGKYTTQMWSQPLLSFWEGRDHHRHLGWREGNRCFPHLIHRPPPLALSLLCPFVSDFPDHSVWPLFSTLPSRFSCLCFGFLKILNRLYAFNLHFLFVALQGFYMLPIMILTSIKQNKILAFKEESTGTKAGLWDSSPNTWGRGRVLPAPERAAPGAESWSWRRAWLGGS